MSEMHYRTLEIRPGHYDDKEKRLSLAFVSEEPVRREFGYEVIDQGQMDLSFMESGRAPLLWMHDAEIAWESPLEKGVFHYPAGLVDKKPPKFDSKTQLLHEKEHFVIVFLIISFGIVHNIYIRLVILPLVFITLLVI